ncbi:MAG TPA: Gfo/Idh/MocA family oxidoreductase [bacterium]|nr:Gfo/Idh/MocA family oxidoreductase [bacterium]HOL35229.1 Gfo/Idh/MocA family oxidoreductase [bacterium]HPP08974.1 Gfo/Idh/MocA family oxidoreductase [bacterium]
MLNIGIVGAGNRGIRCYGIHIMKEKRDVARIVAISDPDKKRLAVAKQVLCLNDDDIYTDTEKMLDKKGLDAVIITSPDYTHRDIAIAAFERGLDVLCEKPLALTVDDCDEILKAQEKSGKILCVGFVLRYNNFYRKMYEIVNVEKKIGRLIMAGGFDSVSTGSQYFFHGWWRLRRNSGGLLVQKATHSIDILNWIIGSRASRVYGEGGLAVFGGNEPDDKVCSSCSKRFDCPEALLDKNISWDYGEASITMEVEDKCVFAKEIDVYDHEILTINYENHVKAFFVESQFTPDYKREFWFIGDRAKIYGIDPYIVSAADNRKPYIEIVYRHTREKEIVPVTLAPGGHGGGDPGLVDDFLRCCLTRDKVLADGIAGRESIAICAGGEKSIETGKIVYLR